MVVYSAGVYSVGKFCVRRFSTRVMNSEANNLRSGDVAGAGHEAGVDAMNDAPADIDQTNPAYWQQLSPEQMESLYDDTMRNFAEGEVVRGQVVELGQDHVLVDIGYKSEGIVPIHEFDDPSKVSVGDEFDVYIEEPEDDEGMPALSKTKADRIKNWAYIQKVYDENGVVEGTVTRRVKGGLKIDIGIDAFMPASQLSWRPTGDLDQYIGQRVAVKIIKLTRKRRNVVVSRRKLLEEQRAEERDNLLSTIEVGQVLTGEVKNITDFGAFVDVGGIDGLLHVTDMSWGRVKHPSQAVSVGQTVDVMVLSFDPRTERISLGLKQKTDNPWHSAAERYPVGSVVRGYVVSMTDYGAFVQLEEGVEGMVHVSEMSWTRRVRHPADVVSLDEEVDVMVLSVDPENEKIALGIKQTQPNPWMQLEERYPVGSTAKGIVRNMTDYGAFVQIEEGIDGLLHVSDLSWTKKVAHPSEVVQRNQEIEVKILSIDPANEKISVGLKQLEEDPWVAIAEKYPIGSHVDVSIAKLVSFGAFARLENGIEGLIHVSELADERVQKPEDVISVGDNVTAKVISVDPGERKIGLSIREYNRDLEMEAQRDFGQGGKDAPVAIGEALGNAVPKSLIQAGRSFTDVANEMMAAVSSESVQKKEPESEESPAQTAEQADTPAKIPEQPDAGEPQAEEIPPPAVEDDAAGAFGEEASSTGAETVEQHPAEHAEETVSGTADESDAAEPVPGPAPEEDETVSGEAPQDEPADTPAVEAETASAQEEESETETEPESPPGENDAQDAPAEEKQEE